MMTGAEEKVHQGLRPRVALVIGSGGIKCAAAIGLWRVLKREQIPLDLAVGCSGGSIYAAAIALGYAVETAEERTRDMWKDVFKRFHLRSVLRATLPWIFGFNERVGLVDDRRIHGVMEELYGDLRFADTPIPLLIAATDLHSMEKVVLREGRIADAVRASIALPLFLRPWPLDGRLLIDGGTSNPLPVDIAIREGADIIIAMGFESTPPERFDNLFNVIAQTSTIAVNHLLRSTYAFYSMVHHAEVLPIIPTFDRRIGIGDSDQIPYIVRRGEEAAEAALPYLRRLLDDAVPAEVSR
jgi:NTE family protein